MASFQDNYGIINKALHYFAFKTSKMQLALADQESREHQQQLAGLSVEKPVFITALPRSGTTILLEVLSKTDAFSYHSYQDMPFVLTPLLWAKFSRLFATGDQLTERAHNDGIKINRHSPEAFEEMLWRAFWPRAYDGPSIELWPETANHRFDVFFTEHIKKLLWRDQQQQQAAAGSQRRYLSKNNLNIIRLGYIKRLFPDSVIMIPFREPLQHALSLLKQQQNFTAMHQENKFSRDYMAAIGHFDFGANLKPANFAQWFGDTRFTPDSVDFWLAYWIESYQYLLDNARDSAVFVGFDRLCRQPESSFAQLAEHLAIAPQTLQQSLPLIKVAKSHPIAADAIDPQNREKAAALYRQLLAIAVNQ